MLWQMRQRVGQNTFYLWSFTRRVWIGGVVAYEKLQDWIDTDPMSPQWQTNGNGVGQHNSLFSVRICAENIMLLLFHKFMVSHFFYYVHTFCMFILKLASTSDSLRYLRFSSTPTPFMLNFSQYNFCRNQGLVCWYPQPDSEPRLKISQRERGCWHNSSVYLLTRERSPGIERSCTPSHSTEDCSYCTTGLVIEQKQKERYHLPSDLYLVDQRGRSVAFRKAHELLFWLGVWSVALEPILRIIPVKNGSTTIKQLVKSEKEAKRRQPAFHMRRKISEAMAWEYCLHLERRSYLLLLLLSPQLFFSEISIGM